MNLNRRRFLQHGATVASLSWLPTVDAMAGTMVAVVENEFPLSHHFAASQGFSKVITCNLVQPLHFSNDLRAILKTVVSVSGCTRESTAFVIGEMLRGERWQLETIISHRDVNAPEVGRPSHVEDDTARWHEESQLLKTDRAVLEASRVSHRASIAANKNQENFSASLKFAHASLWTIKP